MSKMLEAFSVMRMNDGKFTSTLQKKAQEPSGHMDSVNSVASSGETRKMSESLSSSTSSSSTALERQDSYVDSDGIVSHLPQSPLHRHLDCRYSASFSEVLGVKDPWSECPPYESASAQPPPYSETPDSYGIQVADDVVVNQPNAAKSRRRPMAMLRKVKSSFRSASPSSQGKDKKPKGEKRRLFGLRKSSEDRRRPSRQRPSTGSSEDLFETSV